MAPMISMAFAGVRRLLRGVGVALPHGFVWIVLIGGAALVVAVVVIWAVGKKKNLPF